MGICTTKPQQPAQPIAELPDIIYFFERTEDLLSGLNVEYMVNTKENTMTRVRLGHKVQSMGQSTRSRKIHAWKWKWVEAYCLPTRVYIAPHAQTTGFYVLNLYSGHRLMERLTGRC